MALVCAVIYVIMLYNFGICKYIPRFPLHPDLVTLDKELLQLIGPDTRPQEMAKSLEKCADVASYWPGHLQC